MRGLFLAVLLVFLVVGVALANGGRGAAVYHVHPDPVELVVFVLVVLAFAVIMGRR